MMTKRYRNLQKKLQELEAELHFIFSLPPEIAESHDRRRMVASEIQQHFMFVNKLLSQEIASNPPNPHHLHHIARRLTDLETRFRDWEASTTVEDFESDSICSCDDDEPDRTDGPADVRLEEVAEETEDMKVGTEGAAIGKKNGRNFLQFARFCGVFAGGIILGTILTGMSVVEFSGSFISACHRDCLIPT